MAYKNHPALVGAIGEKIELTLPGGEKLRVREKDIELIHPGPAPSPEAAAEPPAPVNVREVWELLEGSVVSLRELTELAYGDFSPQNAWAAFLLLREGLYFTGSPGEIHPRPAAEVLADEQKRDEKHRDLQERESFLDQLRAGTLVFPAELLVSGAPAQETAARRFLQDVEALALGQTNKSRTLRDLGLPETPQEAHRLLLKIRMWTTAVNPYPARFGLSPASAREALDPVPAEDRRDLTGLRAYAIDNAHSSDPDDAISIDDAGTLYVHVADPAAAILPGSPADLEARGRGATLYLPEGAARMLAEAAIPQYALGLSELSPALSFKISLREDGSVADTEIFPSLVRVRRMSYEEAGRFLTDPASTPGGLPGNSPAPDPASPEANLRRDLAALRCLAEANLARRISAGAAVIELPEVFIHVAGEQVAIEPVPDSAAAAMVRECMLLAGEGAAHWALQRRLPFPFVTQEMGDLPRSPLPGMAGSYQLRRSMRPRALSAKPGRHAGLGLEVYTQVTSPLRRYTDLLAHQQIRAFLRAAPDRPPLDEEAVLFALAAGEAAASATVQAERASRAHWTAVYLADRIGSSWEGFVMEQKGPRTVFMIPALALETQVPVKGDLEPNQPVTLTLASVNIPGAEAAFSV